MSLTISISVVPSSGRQCWTIDRSGNLKCYLKNPAEKGLANKELIKRLAKDLKVRQDQIVIISGATSRKKVIKIAAEMTQEELYARLGIEQQQSIF